VPRLVRRQRRADEEPLQLMQAHKAMIRRRGGAPGG
jgi:hypothetical protein